MSVIHSDTDFLGGSVMTSSSIDASTRRTVQRTKHFMTPGWLLSSQSTTQPASKATSRPASQSASQADRQPTSQPWLMVKMVHHTHTAFELIMLI